jgi:hypothetical protein
MLDKTLTEKAGTYQAPRIITHSAEQLEGSALSVNACTGFNPGRAGGEEGISTDGEGRTY